MRASPSVYAVVALVAAASGSAAWAQTSGAARWEIEVHGGGTGFGSAVRGAAGSLPRAETFTTSLNCLNCPVSRRVSSWYFGDGSQLLNDTAAALRQSLRVTPLDGVLAGPLARRASGGSVGVRVGRVWNDRVGSEFTLDYDASPLTIDDQTRAAIEATRASFQSAWSQFAATGPFSQPRAASTADITAGSVRRLVSTGAMTVNLRTRGRLIPYVAGGGGLISAFGAPPSARLAGSYQFLFVNVAPISERDTVTVRVVPESRTPVGLVGGGVRWHASARWGVRADVRLHVSPDRTTTLLDARPETDRGTPSTFLFSATTPSIQFSNMASPTSSLGGPGLTGVETFKSTGMRRETQAAAGVFLRF